MRDDYYQGAARSRSAESLQRRKPTAWAHSETVRRGAPRPGPSRGRWRAHRACEAPLPAGEELAVPGDQAAGGRRLRQELSGGAA